MKSRSTIPTSDVSDTGGFYRTFRDAFKTAGGELIAHDPYVAGETDLVPYLRRLGTRGVDGLVLAGIDEAIDVISLLDELELSFTVLGTDDLGGLSRSAVTRVQAADVLYTAFYLPERGQGPENRRFRHDYQTRYGVLPDHIAALSYDAAMLIGSAALEVGPDRHRIRDWIAAVGRTVPVFPGATGPIRFNEHGDVVNKPVLIARVGR